MISPRLKYLFERYFEKTATDQERSELIALLQELSSGADLQKPESRKDRRETESGKDLQEPGSGTNLQKLESGADRREPGSGIGPQELEADADRHEFEAGTRQQELEPGPGLQELEADADLRELIGQAYARQTTDPPLPAQSAHFILHSIFQATGKGEQSAQRPATIRRIPYRRWAITAAAVLLFSTGGYRWWRVSHRQESAQTIKTVTAYKNDVAPGHDGAILTLANGATVLLDSAHNGSLATEGATRLVKHDGELTYTAPENSKETLYNTMTTPRGRQYRLVLADGSKVWLNSASSLRYPTSFTGNKREVELTGEGYFEIQDNATQPFIVKTKRMDVRVLGTGFNVMAYEDEDAVRTTLIHGSVKVQAGNSTALITPGQQASLPEGNEQVSLSSPDMAEVLAWKDDKFRFKSTRIKTIMRQLARWYDVRIVYKGEIPDIELSGVFPRREYASQLLEVLEDAGKIHFTMEGNTITVMPAEK